MSVDQEEQMGNSDDKNGIRGLGPACTRSQSVPRDYLELFATPQGLPESVVLARGSSNGQ